VLWPTLSACPGAPTHFYNKSRSVKDHKPGCVTALGGAWDEALVTAPRVADCIRVQTTQQ